MGDRLMNRVAIITGSGRGIGRAIALGMAKEGANVVTNDVDPGIAEAVAKEIVDSGGKALAYTGDISDFGTAQKLTQAAVDHFGRLDILVNNAGIVIGHFALIWDMTEESWDSLIAVHLKGTFNCIRHASALMKEQRWGRIINTTSWFRLGAPEHCHYCAAKAGIVGLTKSVAIDVAPYGVTCNVYGPSAATRMSSSELQKPFYQRYVSGGATTESDSKIELPGAEAMVPLLIYLCTDEAANINGQLFEAVGLDISIHTEERKHSIHREEGLWTTDELIRLVPQVLFEDLESKIKFRSPGS